MVGQFEEIASAIIVFLVMLGMGASLTPRDWRGGARPPRSGLSASSGSCRCSASF